MIVSRAGRGARVRTRRSLPHALGRVLGLALAIAAGSPAAAAEPDGTGIPTGKGLPVSVRAAIYFLDVESFDDNAGTFTATTDLRLTWADPRLAYPAAEALNGYKEFRRSAAETALARIWTPRLRVVNRLEEPEFSERRLRIYPDGTVEVIARTTASYRTPIDVARFPFDHQPLRVQVAVHEETIEEIELTFRQDDVNFSRASRDLAIAGWTPGLVTLNKDVLKGWNGDRYAVVAASLDVRRGAGATVYTVFIPLFASLLIPFLATWMNRADDGGGFQVEAFELANVIIGGLFAIIALSFSIGSAYPIVAGGDNTVTRLIALNYVALATGVLVTVALYRYTLLARWFGPYVQEQAFRFLSWSIPVAFASMGAAIVLAAAL